MICQQIQVIPSGAIRLQVVVKFDKCLAGINM